jgi:dATP pyrophosphohydrolase
VAQLVPAVRPTPSKTVAQAPAEEEALDVEQLLQELDETAAQREVEEETGISAPLGALVDWHLSNTYEIYPAWRHRYAPGVVHNTEQVFSLCVPATTPVRLSAREHQAWQWLDWRAAADACFSASNAEAILWLPRFYTAPPAA